MHIPTETLDDLLTKTLTTLVNLPFNTEATRSGDNGPFSEITGAALEITNPRARLSRSDTKGKTFSALGEFLWYMSGSEDLGFIKYYIFRYEKESFDGKTIYGAYGPRLLNSGGKINQLQNVINKLAGSPTSRRAVIQLFEARDMDPNNPDTKESIPCTCTLQFLIRDKKLNMITHMRSNDAFYGLSHDVFAFTLLQEFIASSLNIEVGKYQHLVGSLHLYEKQKKLAEAYINEGFHPKDKVMPAMPPGDQSAQLRILLQLEEAIRLEKQYDIENSGLKKYWCDLAYLLVAFSQYKKNDQAGMTKTKEKFSDRFYNTYIDILFNSKTNSLS